MMHISSRLGMTTGMLVAVPNPSPADSSEIQNAINKSLQSASAQGIEGPAITPYILAEVERATGGKSLDANIALVLNNARVACNIAKEFMRISTDKNTIETPIDSSSVGFENLQQNARDQNDILVVGGAVIDIISTASSSNANQKGEYEGLILKSSNPGSTMRSVGGVGRNVASAVARLRDGTNICLLSVVSRDNAGHEIMRDLSKRYVLYYYFQTDKKSF